MDPTVVLIQGGGFMKQGSIFIQRILQTYIVSSTASYVYRIKTHYVPPPIGIFVHMYMSVYMCIYIYIRILQLYILYVYTYIGTERDRGNSGSFQ